MNNASSTRLRKVIRTLAAGPLVAQLLLLASSPILTRLFSPEDFAIVAIFLLMAASLASIACLKLDNTIMKVKSSAEAARLAFAALISAFFVSFCVLVAGSTSVYLFKNGEYLNFTFLLVQYLMIGAMYEILNALAMRRHLAGIVTKARILLAVSSLLVQFFLGANGLGPVGFIFGLVIGYLVATIYLMEALRVRRVQLLRSARWASLPKTFARYRNDWCYGGPSALFNSLQHNFLSVAFSFFVSTLAGGFMALAQRVVFNPLAICTGILSQSLVPWLSQSGHPEAEASLVKVSSAASAGVLGCVILFYPWLGGIFLFVFGENWRLAGIYAGILLLFIPMRLLFDLLVVALVVRNRQGVVFLFRVFTLISGLATLQLLSDAETIALIVTYSIVQATVAVIGILIALRALGTPPPAIFTSMVICMGAAYCGASNELLLASILGAQSLSVLFLLLGSTVLYISVASLRKTYKANHA